MIELPEGDTTGDVKVVVVVVGNVGGVVSGGAPGVKNPTCRTLGSITVRDEARRGSMGFGWRWIGDIDTGSLCVYVRV